MVLMDPNMLPFVHAEKLLIGRPCSSVKRKHIVKARYHNGTRNFSDEINMALKPYFRTIDIRRYETQLTLQGEIAENGIIYKLESNDAFNQKIGEDLGRELQKLPALEPATIDGKPAKEKFIITFTFSKGLYHIHYHFGDVEDN